MPLQLSLGTVEDMHELVSLVFVAYSDPPNHPFLGLVLPDFGETSQENRTRGIRNAVKGHLLKWKATPSEKWVKVVDTETGKIAGLTFFPRIRLARWQIFTSNPFPSGAPHVEANWYPEKSRIREYCEFQMNDRLQRQATRCAKPHVWLNMICTHPMYRRRGVASLMMQWGVARADEVDVEMFIEAATDGREVYQKFGFVDGDRLSTPCKSFVVDEEWKRLEETYPFEATWMWRPKRSDGKAMEA